MRWSVCARRVAATAMVLSGLAVAQAQDASASEGPTQNGDPSEIKTLIEQLGAADYADREAADARLREIGIPAIDALAECYQRHEDYEQSMRIQRIAEHIYFWDRVLGKNGFLGIQHRRYGPQSTYFQPNDQRIPPDIAAFAIERVIEGTSADRAGLKPGDVVISVNGNRLPATAQLQEFADQIRGKLPGTEMVFELWRGNKLLTKKIKIGHRPPSYYHRNQAPRDLQEQFDRAAREFPAWWAPRFGARVASSPTDDRPALDGFEYLPVPLPSEGDRK